MEATDMLTVKEVADYLKVSEKTVRRLIADHELGYCFIRHQIRVPGYRLTEYIERSEVGNGKSS